MLDGGFFPLRGLQNNFHNTPVAVVSLLNGPIEVQATKNLQQTGMQQLWQWIKYKALGVQNKMLQIDVTCAV